jgi:hypothetical protein
MWFNLKGGLWNRCGSNERHQRRWWNSVGISSSILTENWHGDAWERCTQAYIGVWEESGRFKIRIRDKIRV